MVSALVCSVAEPACLGTLCLSRSSKAQSTERRLAEVYRAGGFRCLVEVRGRDGFPLPDTAINALENSMTDFGGDKFGLHSVGRLFGQTGLESENPRSPCAWSQLNVNLVPPGYCLVAPVARQEVPPLALSRSERSKRPAS